MKINIAKKIKCFVLRVGQHSLNCRLHMILVAIHLMHISQCHNSPGPYTCVIRDSVGGYLVNQSLNLHILNSTFVKIGGSLSLKVDRFDNAEQV